MQFFFSKYFFSNLSKPDQTMWLHKNFIKPLCKPPRSLKGTPAYLHQKYLNYYTIYGMGVGIFPVILLSLFFGRANLSRVLASFVLYGVVVLLVWKRKYSALSLGMMTISFSILFLYWRSPDRIDAYYAPFMLLISITTVGCSQKGLALYIIMVLVVSWTVAKPNMAEFVKTAPREQLELAVQRSFLGMLRGFAGSSLIILARSYIQEKIYTKWMLLRKQINEQNIQLQKSNEDLNKALEEKETFILSFSHESRNPLNGLLGNLHILSEMTLPPEATHILKKVLICSKILKNILLTILDSGRTGQSCSEMVLVPTSTDMKKFIEEIWILSKDLIRAKGLAPRIYISPGIPAKLMIDPERTTQVIFNLISNAIKFTEKGFIKLSFAWNENLDDDDKFMKTTFGYFTAIDTDLKTDAADDRNFQIDQRWFRRPLREERGNLAISVVDTGCGIKEVHQKMIFEKFGQAHSDSQLKSLGLGLGLWISKKIVDAHKGEITLKSKEGVGSSFMVTFPTTTGILLTYVDQEAISPEHKTKSRALVVEDFPINQIINAEMLKKYGIQEITVASNGQQAVQIFQEHEPGHFDVVTMDLEMPVMKGKDAIIKIREWEMLKRSPNTKIVIISGNAVEKEIQECLNPRGMIRADAFLEKPCDFMTFSKTLKKLNVRGGRLKLGRLKRKKVLFADDDFFNLDVLMNFAKQLGIDYLAARNGKEAVEIFEKNFKDISVIFLDNEMPIMSGIDACETISKIKQKEKLKCRIILVSGISIDRTHVVPNGFDGVIQKPFTFQSFNSILKSINEPV